MQRARWVGAGLLTAGACVSVPEFKGGTSDGGIDAAVDAGACGAPDYSGNGNGTISFSDDNGGGLVTAPMYTMHFAGGSQFHFPDDVRVTGVDIMSPLAQTCAQEDLAGMAMFPAAAIRANSAATAGPNDLAVVPGWAGPAVTKLVTHWGTTYSCGASPGGDSHFTLFPDGRVVRHDYMFNTTDQDWNACDCNGGASFYPTSYWTFDQAAFSTIQIGSGSATPVADYNGQVNDQAVACMENAGGGVSVATGWRIVAGATGTRVLEVNSAIAYVYDFVRDHQNVMPGPFEYTTTSQLVLGGGCTTGLARSNEFVSSPREITINGTPRMPGGADGIYGGANDRSGTGGFALTAMTAQLESTNASPGFAVWLRFPQQACSVTVTKSPDPGAGFYTKQRIDDDEWVFWFRDALTAQETITVTAQ